MLTNLLEQTNIICPIYLILFLDSLIARAIQYEEESDEK